MTDEKKVRKWGWGKTAVILITIFYALLNTWRAISIQQQADFLDTFNPIIATPVRLYITIGWAIIFTILTLNIWRKWWISNSTISIAIVAYALYRFGLSTQFAQSSYVQQSVTFFTFLHILIALMVFITNRHYKRSYV